MAVFAISVDDPSTSNKVVGQFMAAHKYSIPVLRGSAYEDEAGITGTPTTLFIDPNGDIAFEKVGESEHLVQEFDWRLQAMRKNPAPAERTASAKPQ